MYQDDTFTVIQWIVITLIVMYQFIMMELVSRYLVSCEKGLLNDTSPSLSLCLSLCHIFDPLNGCIQVSVRSPGNN